MATNFCVARDIKGDAMCENSFSCDCVMIISINEMNSRIQFVKLYILFFCLFLVSLTSDMW